MSYLGSGSYELPKQNPKTWLDYCTPEYAQNVAQWCYTRDHYTGECVAPWKIPQYLHRKKIGEALEAFEERVLQADYTPHFGSVVDTLAGMLAAKDPDASRPMGKGADGKRGVQKGPLGNMKDPTTLMGRLALDCDGEGNGWLTFWNLVATELVGLHDVWVLVDGKVDGRNPKVKLIEAERVINWRFENDVLIEAVMKEMTDRRTSVQDDPEVSFEEQWVVFEVAGWTRWRIMRDATTGEDKPVIVNSGKYEYYNRSGQRTIPLFRSRLPLKRNVGYLMARKANAIFNKESERDHLIRFACFPILNAVANDTLFKKIVAWLREGARVLQVMPGTSAHSFIAPEIGPATTLEAVIEQKTRQFYSTSFREFGAAGRAGRDRVTATEVQSDSAVGIGAFLQLLRSAVDNAENTAFYLLEQTVFPSDRSKWGQASVSRSQEFSRFDQEAVIDALIARYFGAGVTIPIGKSARKALAREIVEYDGLPVNENEISEEVDTRHKLLEAEIEHEVDARMKSAFGSGDPMESVVKKSRTTKKVTVGGKTREVTVEE